MVGVHLRQLGDKVLSDCETVVLYATGFGLKLSDHVWTALTFALGLTLRLFAIRYKWEMPKFVFDSEKP